MSAWQLLTAEASAKLGIAVYSPPGFPVLRVVSALPPKADTHVGA